MIRIKPGLSGVRSSHSVNQLHHTYFYSKIYPRLNRPKLNGKDAKTGKSKTVRMTGGDNSQTRSPWGVQVEVTDQDMLAPDLLPHPPQTSWAR